MEASEHGEWSQKLNIPLMREQMQRRITEEEGSGNRRPSFAESEQGGETTSVRSGVSGRSGISRSSALRYEVRREDIGYGEGSEAGSSERSRTPGGNPIMAVRNGGGGGVNGGEISPLRKITGPREMPRSFSSGGGGGNGGVGVGVIEAVFQDEEHQPKVLMGTRRRKPVPSGRR